jgi:hypothetical protein
MHGYIQFLSFSYHTHFPLCPFCPYAHDFPVIFISRSHIFRYCRFFPYIHDSPVIFKSRILIYCQFCLHPLFSCNFHITHFLLSQIYFERFAGVEEAMSHTYAEASQWRWLRQTGASEGGKEMMEENMSWIWQALERVNGLTLARRKGVWKTVIYQPMHG